MIKGIQHKSVYKIPSLTTKLLKPGVSPVPVEQQCRDALAKLVAAAGAGALPVLAAMIQNSIPDQKEEARADAEPKDRRVPDPSEADARAILGGRGAGDGSRGGDAGPGR